MYMQCTDFCIGNSFTKVQGDRPTQWLGKVRDRNSNRLCTCISSCHTFRNGIKLGVSGQFQYDANLDCHYSQQPTSSASSGQNVLSHTTWSAWSIVNCTVREKSCGISPLNWTINWWHHVHNLISNSTNSSCRPNSDPYVWAHQPYFK